MFTVCDIQPIAASHTSAVQESESSQFRADPPPQTPLEQVSFNVHASPLLHAEPSAFVTSEQTPVTVSQTPGSWHGSEAVHVTGLLPTQAPAWQVSVWVQALPSPQLVPSGVGGLEHAPVAVSQTPLTWH
jgi:hypothetical protein